MDNPLVTHLPNLVEVAGAGVDTAVSGSQALASSDDLFPLPSSLTMAPPYLALLGHQLSDFGDSFLREEGLTLAAVPPITVLLYN